MPVLRQIDCPECGKPLVRKRAGRCSECGADIRRHVQEEREKETRIDQVIAVISTLLVLGVFLFVGGFKILEGIAAYAVAGALIWWFARRTFW